MTRNPNWQSATTPSTSAGSGASAAATAISRPGAYTISRNSEGSMQVFRVTIPPNVQPNQEFQVYGTSIL